MMKYIVQNNNEKKIPKCKTNETKNKNLKLILIISEIQDLTYLNFNIVNISMIYDIFSLNIKETILNENIYFIKKICKNILLL